MALGKLWAGRAYGTNTGNLFLKLEGEDGSLSGALHLNDPDYGLTVYSVDGSFDGFKLEMSGQPQKEIEGTELGKLTASAVLDSKGQLKGEWHTDIGSSGTFVLFPHESIENAKGTDLTEPSQIYTARHNFEAVALDRQQIIDLAEAMQDDFTSSEVVVTIASGTEQTRLLSDFRSANLAAEQADLVKLYVQQPETNGVNRVATVEFGQHVNMVMVQGADEAWVLGMVEKLKRYTRPLERTNTTKFKKLNFGINQVLFVGALVYLPSLSTLRDRAILMIGVLLIIQSVNWLHMRFLPHAAISLVPKPRGVFAANAISWLIAVTSAVAATLLAAYLQGQFPVLFPSK
ncbi:hypothetical protein [Ruegeria sp. HKCCD6119]|uniref:hypothetical protein n=1 Tax=Ruegeria sp. HKCCD6119 TaxID=2683003 RepID=UPI00149203C8|nr:hypothetical protein [Ruegeria sp. HKCCD6119]NOD83767.1 hypothetical protein [Ruegeria sp. HKCCD6119]